jgi:hypothetical protein
MTKRGRRNPSPAFKAKAASAAVKNEKTVAEYRSGFLCAPGLLIAIVESAGVAVIDSNAAGSSLPASSAILSRCKCEASGWTRIQVPQPGSRPQIAAYL